MNTGVLLAIFKRNFVSYFLNPTGYVFICVFVLLNSLAAFWPAEFFTSNLAGLDQLNKYFPLIMLIFIPAITMSTWAEERRQGTDELLLTIPATDFDVVMGKYLAAVAIFAVSLLFSAVCNVTVLMMLGNPDLGLMAATYIGYFLVGTAMLAIGLVASFLTSNITVGFVLGALFNAVLVGLEYVDLVLPQDWSNKIRVYGIAEQLRDFTQGVVSLSGVAYFLSIVAVMLYLAMVLIGRRHWSGGRDGVNLAPHYLARTIALGAAAVGVFLAAQAYPARKDLSVEQLSALAPQTVSIVEELDKKKPVHIEAFISANVPDSYVPVRLDLVNRLREIKAHGGGDVSLRINTTEPYSPESDRAEKLYGITGREVEQRVRGQASVETIFMGVALTSGLDKIVIPFVDHSTPIEYELIRSIAVLGGSEKKTLGIFAASKELFKDVSQGASGQMDAADTAIVAELRHQYNVVELDAAKAVPDDIDVMLVIQPSLCQPNQIDNLVAAVRRGIPALVMEDPLAYGFGSTIVSQELQQSGGAPFIQAGSIGKFWDLLGIESANGDIVTHEYNPISSVSQMPEAYVFIGNGALGRNAGKQSLFDEADPVSAKTKELVFVFPGWVKKKEDAKLDFKSLVRTSQASGHMARTDVLVRSQSPFGPGPWRVNFQAKSTPTGDEYVLAARIRGPAPPEPAKEVKMLADAGATNAATAPKNEIEGLELAQAPTPTASATATGGKTTANPYAVTPPTSTATGTGAPAPTAAATGTADAAKPKEPKDMHVIYIADLDILASAFFSTRSTRRQSEYPVEMIRAFDNISFVLNSLDSLAGDERFLEIRKRRPEHRTLTRLSKIEEDLQIQLQREMQKRQEKWEKELTAEDQRWNEEIEKLRNDTKLKLIDKNARAQLFQQDRERVMQKKRRDNELKFQQEQKEEMRKANEQIRANQAYFKQLAVFVPPVFPLLIGLLVYFSRRAGEQEGVDRARLK